MVVFNPVKQMGWSRDQIRTALLAAVGAQGPEDFRTKWAAWQRSSYDQDAPGRGQAAVEDLVDNMIGSLPGGQLVTGSVRAALIEQVAGQLGRGDVAAILAGQAPGWEGEYEEDVLGEVSDRLGGYFGSGGDSTSGLGVTDVSFGQTMAGLADRYTQALAAGDSERAKFILDTMRSPSFQGQLKAQAARSTSGNSQRNRLRMLDRLSRSNTSANAGEHFWDSYLQTTGRTVPNTGAFGGGALPGVTQPALPALPSPGAGYRPNPTSGSTPAVPVYSTAPAGGIGRGGVQPDFPLPHRDTGTYQPNRPIAPLAPGGPGASAASAWLIDTWRGVGGPSRLLPWAQAEVDQTRAAQQPGFFGDTGYQDAVDPETEEERRRRLAGVAW